MKRFFALCMALCLLAGGALADTESVRGYQKGEGYQYVTYGRYPYEEDGTVRPQLWRVLTVEDGIAFLITEEIIDFVQYHSQKDKDKENPLRYEDTLMYAFCNGEMLDALLTERERAALVPLSGERGLIGLGTCEELQNPATGFSRAKYTEDRRRQAVGTPYAYARGLRRIDRKGHSWYFTADWRRLGFRWIVGDNGHISCVGSDRFGGVRPVMYVDLIRVRSASGDGTADSPFVWEPAD